MPRCPLCVPTNHIHRTRQRSCTFSLRGPHSRLNNATDVSDFNDCSASPGPAGTVHTVSMRVHHPVQQSVPATAKTVEIMKTLSRARSCSRPNMLKIRNSTSAQARRMLALSQVPQPQEAALCRSLLVAARARRAALAAKPKTSMSLPTVFDCLRSPTVPRPGEIAR